MGGGPTEKSLQPKKPDPNCPVCAGTGKIMGMVQVWGGTPDCQHDWATAPPRRSRKVGDVKDSESKQATNVGSEHDLIPTDICKTCGAWKGQLGLEPTPELYVEHLVMVAREIRRVLRSDGTFWLNIGDSYAGGGTGHKDTGKAVYEGETYDEAAKVRTEVRGLKPKDLCLIPSRLALALQADGWWVRKDIIWHKPNPMPESVRDRPTTAHEYIWLLTKSGDSLYWTHPEKPGVRTNPEPDIRWVDRLTETYYKEKPAEWSKELVECPDCEGGQFKGWFGDEKCETCKGKGKVQRWYKKNLWKGHDYFYDQDAIREPYAYNRWGGALKKSFKDSKFLKGDAGEGAGGKSLTARDMDCYPNPVGRNIRSVWTIQTEPYPEAHFATFPEELPEKCIKAGTSEKGCCAKCGAPYERVVEVSRYPGQWGVRSKKVLDRNDQDVMNKDVTTVGWEPTCECKSPEVALSGVHRKIWQDEGPTTEKGRQLELMSKEIYGGNQKSRSLSDIYGRALQSTRETVGWNRTCECTPDVSETKPCVVLDPFAGSGTTGWVARRLGRDAILIEINPEYAELIRKRAFSDVPDLLRFKDETDNG